MQFDGERVDTHVRDSELDSARDALLEGFRALPRDSAHKIAAHVGESLVSRLDRSAGSLRVVGAPDGFKHLVVEALHANGEPVHPKSPDVADHVRSEAFGVRLHRAFHVGLEAHRRRERVEQHRQSRHADMARGAPAQIHRLDC